MDMSSLLSPAFWTPGWMEWIVIMIVAVLLFGKRLPELGRSLGQSIVEFRKGLSGLQDEIAKAGETPPPPFDDKSEKNSDEKTDEK
jgi:sec-independent protein translocase protein TatA